MGKNKKSRLTRAETPTPSVQELQQATIRAREKATRIIGEVKEKRERNIKNFFKEDSTFEAVIYNEPVHYYDKGEWKDIDNSIIDGKDDENNDVLENKDNDIKIKIAKKVKSKKLVTVKKDKYEISWGIDKSLDSDAKVKGKEKTRSNKESKSISKNSDKQIQYRQQEDDNSIKAANLEKKSLKNISSTIEFSRILFS